MTRVLLLTVLLLAALLAPAADFDLAGWTASKGGRLTRDADGRIAALRLRGAWLTDADLDFVARAGRLRGLDLGLTPVTDVGIQRLKGLQGVIELDLYYAERITDAALAHLKGWRSLERLNLRGTDVTDTALEYIAALASLRSLDVSFTQVTTGGLEHLTGLAQLEELAIGGNKITAAGISTLRALPKLRRLSLNGTQKRNSGMWSVTLTDLDLEAVASLGGLEQLDLGGTRASDLGVGKLAALARLRTLDLGRTTVSASGLEPLAGLPLERLSLWRARRIDDAAAAALARLEKLAVLDLAETAVSDSTLERLRGLAHLGELYVGGTRVTEAGIDAFRRARPGCHVSTEAK